MQSDGKNNNIYERMMNNEEYVGTKKRSDRKEERTEIKTMGK